MSTVDRGERALAKTYLTFLLNFRYIFGDRCAHNLANRHSCLLAAANDGIDIDEVGPTDLDILLLGPVAEESDESGGTCAVFCPIVPSPRHFLDQPRVVQ